MKTSGEKSSNESLRQKAEKLLINMQPKNDSIPPEEEMQKLVHELHVHQIELELQNEELILAIEQAESASEKYTELFDFAPIGYFTLTQNAEIVELNLVGAKMLGKERSQLQNSHFCLFVSNSSKSVFNSFIERVFESFKTESCEVTISTNSNLQLYVYLTGLAKENEKNCFVNAVDITQRKQIEAELLQAKLHAEESDRLKTSFLQNMSHEIRTPMNAIKGFSGLLVENHSDKQKLEKFTKIIDQRCDDLLEIINDLLDFSKIESGQLPIYMEECDLTVLFDELSAQFIEYQKHLNKQHLQFRLQVNCSPDATVIITDKGKLKQILINLITNAFKFTDIGCVEGGCKIENNNLVFYVSDTGIGIPHDKQKVIFERFIQLRQVQTNTVGGTGLGLSIVKGLLSLLGGEISLSSEPGKGSTFTFTIPYKVVQPTLKAQLVDEIPEKFSFTGKTILLVEDDAFNILYTKEILADTGLNILVAGTGAEATQMAAKHSVDLILMDIRLPDIDGYAVTQRIRQSYPELKIIAQTAYAALTDKQKALDAGFNDYISKPFKSNLLLSMVNRP